MSVHRHMLTQVVAQAVTFQYHTRNAIMRKVHGDACDCVLHEAVAMGQRNSVRQ